MDLARADGRAAKASTPGFAPDLRLADGAVLEGDGWALEAIHTPGHLGNHLCLALGAICASRATM